MAPDTPFAQWPHRRLNLLTGEWLLVSPHRARRPWQGQEEPVAPVYRPPYAADCYLCPGNPRAGKARNPDYRATFVFPNDFEAVLPGAPGVPGNGGSELLRAAGVRGTCRVICFSPRHDLTLADMPVEAVTSVVDVWSEQIADLGATYRWVQVFENKGATMGCSNPHPHGQVWATDFLPAEPEREDVRQAAYLASTGRPLLLDYSEAELRAADRVVVADADWTVVTPWWAMWPFETLVMPRRHVQRMPDLTAAERISLAEILKRLLCAYDRLFGTSFPYTMGWHGGPTADTGDAPHWQLHAHYYPPLLRSATVRKFMVGYEMLAEPQRDITAEQAAELLRKAASGV
ncbi:MAG: UDP-glucose--hexose-1-phosphate uridylyltransferase [Armatimonadetes bacterium]|nr:UDP-glucose--hexose-1-phosphate uridylyltransferase [Armatimonadota bacterium]